MRLIPSFPHRRTAGLAAGLALGVAASLPGVAVANEFEHPAPAFSGTNTPFEFQQSGSDFFDREGEQGVEFEALTSIPTGNPHSDIEYFTQGGETYASVGTFATSGNQGGQTIVQLTEGGEVENAEGDPNPVFVAGHPSATCLSDPRAATGLQHDVEATPKGDTINNDSYLPPVAEDAQLLIDATDGRGRCHDQGTLGLQGAPLGGLEIIDITDVENPVEIALTSHIGQAHTVNIDPQRPHIAYAVSSDSVGVTVDDNATPDDPADDTYVRNNETTQTTNLDGFEVVDLSSCLYKTAAVPAGTLDPAIKALEGDAAVAAKRAACKPEVYRYRYEDLAVSQGHTLKTSIFGCHELKPYPNDTLTCGSGAAAIVFDMAGAFDENDKPVGDPLPCSLRASSSTAPFQTGAMITDCTVDDNGTPDDTTDDRSLGVPQWLADGAPSLEGVEHLGTQTHIGRAPTEGFATTIPATEDIDFNHETEFSRSGRFLFATDERGGGVAGGAQCTQGESNEQVNGGVHAYRVDRLQTFPESPDRAPGAPEAGTPVTREQADQGYALRLTGVEDDPETADVDESLGKAIYRAPTRTGAEGTFCTAHVLQQVPDQNRIFMGWYTQGTQVLDYVELPGSKLQMVETGYAITPEANNWASQVFKTEQNDDGTVTYYGAIGDINRLSIDIYKVTMPAPIDACDLDSTTGERAEQSSVSDRAQARSVHVENVDCVLNYRISSGKTANADGTPATYAPTEQVTRGQMASFIQNALLRSRDDSTFLPAAGADQFTDIATNTHRAAINRLAQAGIVKGIGGGRFNPDALITRDQMASFIVEAARFAGVVTGEPTRTDYFGDVPAGNVHERNISAGFESELFSGTRAPGATARSGVFSPAVQVQRDQMATFLVKLFRPSIR